MEPTLVKSFTTVFFPPVTVESEPTWTDLQSLVYKGFLGSWSDRIFDTTFGGFSIAVQRDGTLLVTVSDKKVARDIFNVIFAVSALEGIPAHSVRESELSSVQVETKNLEIRAGEPDSQVVLRKWILHDSLYTEYIGRRDRWLVGKQQLSRIISRAEKVFARKDLTDLLLNWLQAKTFFENSDYGQAFVIAWINIEKDIFEVWEKLPEEKKRLLKLTSSGMKNEYPPVSAVLYQLKNGRLLPQDRFDLLKNLNFHRNRFIHAGEEISKEVAFISLSLVKLIVDESMGRI